MCGLLAEIRRATYQAHRQRALTSGRVLFALDEAANIAPLEELPQIASEGGGQGLTLLAAFQDLSPGAAAVGQGRRRVPDAVRDQADPPRDRRHHARWRAVSTTLGEYDRQVVLAHARDWGSAPSRTRARPSRSTPTPQHDRLHPAHPRALRRRDREHPRRPRAAPRRARLGAAHAHRRAPRRAVETLTAPAGS